MYFAPLESNQPREDYEKTFESLSPFSQNSFNQKETEVSWRFSSTSSHSSDSNRDRLRTDEDRGYPLGATFYTSEDSDSNTQDDMLSTSSSSPRFFLNETKKQKSLLQWMATSSVLLTCVFVYFYGLVLVARKNAYVEFWTTVGLSLLSFKVFHTPIAVHRISYPGIDRQCELIALELVFELMVVLTKASWEPSWRVDFCFFLFFTGQTFGFVRDEMKRGCKTAAMRSMSLFFAIGVQYLRSRKTTVWENSSGMFLVFGEDARMSIRIHYGFWLLGVLCEDYTTIMRHGSIQIVHFGSYVLAFFSGEFWHVRLLTAIHSMIIDATIFICEGCPLSQSSFVTLPGDVLRFHTSNIPKLSVVYNLGCGICLAWQVLIVG